MLKTLTFSLFYLYQYITIYYNKRLTKEFISTQRKQVCRPPLITLFNMVALLVTILSHPSLNEIKLEQCKRDLFVYLTFYEAETRLYETSPDLNDDELWEHAKKSRKAFSVVMVRSAKVNSEASSACDAYVQDCIETRETPCPLL